MADSQANININIDTSQALANLKALQSQISAFQTSMARGSATQAANAAKLRQNLVNDINATKKFAASIQNIQTTTESFTEALEKNKLSMGQYFRFAGASTKTFGKLFKSEFNTIEKVARERVKTLQTQYIQLGRDASGAMKAIAVRPLVLDMENLGTKTAIAAQKQQILNQLLKQGSTNMLNWGKNTQWAGRQLMVGFTIPLTMAGTAAAKAFMEMEEAVIKFKRVYGELETTATETDKMARELQKLAAEYTKYGVAVSKTMDMAATAAATGKTGAELMAQVANATKLAVLGGVEQQQALETTISLTNAFGTAAKDLSGNIDFLNAVENQTVTSIEDLTTAIPKAAPVIQQLGGDVKDLAFFLTAMREGGINASEGANALKSGLASMINPTKKASDFLAGFGINLKGIVESNAGNVKGMVVGFAQALNQLDPLNRARAIEQLFGKFQFARISTLFKNVTDQGSQAAKVMELTSRTSQELAILSERELKKVESSPMFKFKKTIEDIKKELIPIGEAFLKAITPIVKFAGQALANFNKMGQGAKNFWIGVTTVVAGVGPVLLMTVGLIANGVANLIKLFTGIKSVFNRTSEDTTVLGEATDYMTQKQLEAASVAASLDQVHQTLEQRFTTEAAAVNLLTDAYQRNVAAQAQYSPSSVVPSDIAGSYATGGIIRGPGSGTSDSILARVSNGEAIVPAAIVKKNPGFISQLVSGNIPGFAQGMDADGASPTDYWNFKQQGNRKSIVPTGNLLPKLAEVSREQTDRLVSAFEEVEIAQSHAGKILKNAITFAGGSAEALKIFVDKVEELIDSGVTGGEELKKKIRESLDIKSNNVGNPFAHIGEGIELSKEEVEKRVASGEMMLSETQLKALKLRTPGSMIPIKHGGGMVLKSSMGPEHAQDINRRLFQPGADFSNAVGQAEFLKLFEDSGLEKWNDSIVMGGGNIEELSTDASILDSKFRELIAALPAGTKIFDLQADAAKYMEQNPGLTGVDTASLYAKARESIAGTQLESVLDRAFSTPSEIRSTGQTEGRDVRLRTAKRNLSAQPMPELVSMAEDSGMKGAGVNAMKAFISGAQAEGAKEENDPFNIIRSKKRNSPHPQAGIDGADDANAYKSAFGNIASDPLAAAKEASGTPLVDVASAQQKLTKKSLTIVSEAIANQGDVLAGVKGKVINVTNGLSQMADAADQAANAAQAQADATQTSTDSKTENTQATEENTGATDKNTDSKKNNTESSETSAQESARLEKGRTKAKFQRAFGTVAKIGAAATTIVGMASMVPGKIGEVAQAITPSIGAFTTLTGMVNGPVTAALAALIAVVGGIVMAIMNLDKAYNETQQKVLSLKSVVGTSAESIKALSEFAGRVGAGEYMDKVRKDRMKLVYAASGKTTFGESYVQSDQGKAQITAIKEDLARKGGNTASTVASITGQLSTAVMSGALSEAEAFSIASNIGAELGNMDITMQVRAQLSEVLGPNGEKISSGGILNVAAGLQERNITTLSEDMQVLSQNMESNRLWSGGENTALNRNITAGGTTLASAGVGAGIGAGIGFMVGGPIGAAIGAGIGAIAGAIVGYNVAMGTLEEQTKAVAELGGVVAADMISLLSTQKELSDSLDAYYLKKIEEARIEGDIVEAKRLQLEYDDKRNQLADVGFQAREAIMQLYSSTDAAELEAIDKGLENALNLKYKDDVAQQVYLPVVQNQLKTAVENDVATTGQVATIKAEMVAGTLTPQDASNLLKIMATDEDQGKKLFSVVTKFGGQTLSDMQQVMGMFSGPDAKDQKAKLLLDVEAAKTPADAQKIIDFTRDIAKYAGVMKSTVLVNTVQKNPEAAAKLQGIFDQLENNKGKMTASVVYSIVPELKGSTAFDEKYFNSLKDANEKITYVKTVSAIMEMSEPELKASDEFKRWLGDEGKDEVGKYGDPLAGTSKRSYPWWQKAYAEDMGVKVTEALKTDATLAPETETGGGGSGPSASWLDPIVTRVRDLYDSAQKLTIGYKASGDALKAFAKTGKSALTGLSGMGDKLYKANLSQDIIDGILGMPKEEAEKWMKMFFDKKGNITQFVKDLNATIGGLNFEQYLQENVATNNALKNQQTSTVALTKFTDNLSVARSILNDENATSILAGAMLSGTLEEQKKKTQQLTKAYLDNMAADRMRKDKRQVEIDDADIRINTLQAENDIYQNGIDIISKKSEKITEAYDKQIEALNKVKDVNEEISKQKQGELDIADALSRGDIGAAAKAIQQMRAQQAQSAADRQIKALEDAKKRAIDSLTVEINGQLFTRSELEGKIYDIELDVLQIKKDQILQNKLSLAQSEEELNNIIAQIAKLKELKALKSLPDNKNTKDNTNTNGNSGGNQNGQNEEPHKEGDDAGNGMIWSKVNGKWKKVKKTVVPDPGGAVTDAGVSAGSNLSATLSNGVNAPKLSTAASNTMMTDVSAGGAKIAAGKALDAKLKSFGTARKAFKDKYGDISTREEANAKFAGDSAKLSAWITDFEKLQTEATSINSMLGSNFKLDTSKLSDASRMIFGGVENQAMSTVQHALSETAITSQQTSSKAAILASLPAEVKEAVAYLQSLPAMFKTDKAKFNELNKPISDALAKLDPNFKDLDILRLKKVNDPAYVELIKKNPGIVGSIDKLSKFSESMLATIRNANFVRNSLSAQGYTAGLMQSLFGDKNLLTPATGIHYGSDYTGQTTWGLGYPAKLAKYATGGQVSGPGTGTSDSVPALLSNGEYVIRANAVRTIGTDALDKLNYADKNTPKFADGGFFGGIGNFLGNAVKNTGNFLGSAGKAIADATPGALQFIKDYIFDPTNPLDWAALLIPGGKVALTAIKVASKLGTLAVKGMKAANFAEKATKYVKIAKDPIGKAVDFAGDKAKGFSQKLFTEKIAPKFAGKGEGTALGAAARKTKDAAVKAQAKADKYLLSNVKYEDLGKFADQTGRSRASLFTQKYLGNTILTSPVKKLKKKFVEGINPLTPYTDAAKDQFQNFVNEQVSAMSSPQTVSTDGTRGNSSNSYRLAMGGMVGRLPKYHKGGLVPGSFEMPIMAKGGEFVMSDYAVKQYGADTLGAMNTGNATVSGDSVYNYSVNVNVANSGANPNDIARTVIAQIKQIDAQRIRSNSL